ncbi:RING-H2 finger protein ATL64-like [Nymphaea colorata]|nr:RING-H2 finger protein ATL64-like [Nymphaea colorata]
MGHFSALPEDYVSTCLSTTGKISLMAAMVLLFAVLFLVLLIHFYVRWSLERSRRRNRALPSTNLPALCNSGLDQSVIRSLPTFSVAAGSGGGQKDDLDCAICLSAFEEKEMGRLLPECNHEFHVDCIDMWFQSHSTCPVCRTQVRHWDSSSNVTSINDGGSPAPEMPSVETVSSPVGGGSDFGDLSDQATVAVSSAEFAGELPAKRSERVEYCSERPAAKPSSENPLVKLKRMLSREKGRSSSSLQACDQESDLEAARQVDPSASR